MSFYVGIDLHSTNSYLGILDSGGRRVFSRRLPNSKEEVLLALGCYGSEISSIAVESTYNWYWLVDCLMDHGYRVRLANPAKIATYSGLKHSDDKHDAFWLAEMLRLDILPEGYIYPKAQRPVRDLLRKRSHLVKLRTSLILSVQGIVSRQTGQRLRADKIKQFGRDVVAEALEGDEALCLSGQVSKQGIDCLSRLIKDIERFVKKRAQPAKRYALLKTVPGIGEILSLTIGLETGEIERFAKVGCYASYCRKVSSEWTSNSKRKGKGNKKNGNRYLAWAFSEAAELARRFDDRAGRYYERKRSKTKAIIAHNALAHKLARASYYIMRDEVAFNHDKLFVPAN